MLEILKGYKTYLCAAGFFLWKTGCALAEARGYHVPPTIDALVSASLVSGGAAAMRHALEGSRAGEA